MPEQSIFSQPSRQSSIAIVFLLGNIFRLLVKQLWVIILVVLFNPKKGMFNMFTLVIIGFAMIGAVMSVISYFRYYYYIKDGELVMEKGVLRKIKVSVPLDRIQTVNFKQGLLHQAFNVVAIDIDTAGSKGNEFSLQALRKEKAEALRDYVENFKQTARSAVPETMPGNELLPGDTEESVLPGTSANNNQPTTTNLELLFHLSPVDLLKIGVSQNHLRTAGIIMAFFIGFFDDLENALDFDLTKEIERLTGLGQEAEFLFYFLLAIPFFLLISFLVSLVNTVLRYYGLRFWQTERGFKMVSGLFTRQEVSANFRKIQFVRWSNNPLKRFFGMVTVRLPQAASVQVGRKLAVGLPGCYEPHLRAVCKAYFPDEESLEFEEHGISPRIVYRQMIYQGLAPVGLAMLLTWSWLGSGIWVWLLWLPAAFWLSLHYHRNWRWKVSEEGLRAKWGVVNNHSVLLQWYKVQAVTIRQNYFLRRRGLAYLTLYTAAGAVGIPYIPIEKARAVQDFVLFKVETDKRKWM